MRKYYVTRTASQAVLRILSAVLTKPRTRPKHCSASTEGSESGGIIFGQDLGLWLLYSNITEPLQMNKPTRFNDSHVEFLAPR